MAASSKSLLSLPLLIPSRPIGAPLVVPNKLFVNTTRTSFIISASKNKDSGHNGHHHHCDGKLVDDNMVVLRMRIWEVSEMEIEDEKKKRKKNHGLMEWERRWADENYSADVCEAVGLLQIAMMQTRPCLALGMLVLVMLSLSISMPLAVFHLVGLAKYIGSLGLPTLLG